MNHAMMISTVTLLVLSAQAFAADMPQRKSGLWESTMSSAQMGNTKVTSQQCIDAKTDADMLKKAMGNGAQSSDCSQHNTKRTASGFEMDSVCKQGDGTFTSHMVVTGDFNSQYKMEMTGRRTPSKQGMSDFQSTVVARHVGACPADMKPGDMKVNGMLIRADGMPANISPEQAAQMRKMMEQMKKQMQQ